MKNSLILVAIIGCLYISLCNAEEETQLEVRSCGKKRTAANIKKLTITGCKQYPCVLTRGTNPRINIDFNLKRRVKNLHVRITGKVNGREIPFGVSNKDHCENTIKNAPKNCILRKRGKFSYSYSLPVKEEYPSLMLIAKYELVDHKGKTEG